MDELTQNLQSAWKNWPLKNTGLLVLGLVFFIVLAGTPQVDSFIKGLGSLGYLGALIAGFFFVLTYTALPAGYVLFELANNLNPLEIAVIAAAGSMLGDYVIFRFIRDRVVHELKPYLSKVGRHPRMRTLLKTPYFAWILPLSGAFIIASPLPDELGVSLIGASKMSNAHFLAFSYLLNVVGIFFIVLLAQG
jgi:hypothetical protein